MAQTSEQSPAADADSPLARTPATAAQWIRAIRARRRVSQRELARLAGVPVSTVSRIESGSSDPRFSTFVMLLRASGHELAARDPAGALVLRECVRETVRDQAGRHPPAHLFLLRVPSQTSTRSRDWWGWGRVAFRDGDPGVPEWTFSRRAAIRSTPWPMRAGSELGYRWDDAT
jgi:transcriptional regulator with XRE-family HTH domain